MSPIQEESPDRDQHITSNLKGNNSLHKSNEHWPGRCTETNSGVQLSEEKGEMESGLGAADGSSEQQGRETCEKNGNRNKEALQRLNLEDATRSLILRQMREVNYMHGGVSLMALLKACLETRPRGRYSIVALSGYIEHFESRLEEDLGWGCGWRNIQMLSSYIIAQNTEYKDALFGGAGFVPDIVAMQQWLEIAWLKGFDVLGADFFGWKISGTHKWIGTTECAALLRSFGVRARVVDFRTASSKRGTDSIVGKGGGSEGGGSHPDQPSDKDDGEDISSHFNQMTVSGDRSLGPSTANPTADSNSPSEENPSSPTADPNGATPEENPVIIIPDHKEELHFLRQSPDDPSICLTCAEERKHNISAASHLHATTGDEETISSGDASEITGAQRHTYSSAGGGGGANPTDFPLNHKYMTDWIWNYFSADVGHSERPSNFSNRSPLYFQHRGHSRTIVGIERCKKDGVNKEEDYLIVLDPSQRTRDIVIALQRKQGWEELVQRGMHTLNQAEYQLCYIDPGIAKGEELESLKTLSSVRYMY